jgi:hypothetical protein
MRPLTAIQVNGASSESSSREEKARDGTADPEIPNLTRKKTSLNH